MNNRNNQKEYHVTCPNCGLTNMHSSITNSQLRCERCKTSYRIFLKYGISIKIPVVIPGESGGYGHAEQYIDEFDKLVTTIHENGTI